MVDAAINHTAVEVKVPEGRPSDYFGKKVFGRAAMRKYLDKRTYAAPVSYTHLLERQPFTSRRFGSSSYLIILKGVETGEYGITVDALGSLNVSTFGVDE